MQSSVKETQQATMNGVREREKFTLQLVYRDAQGRVMRTEEYSSREFVPVLPKKP